MIFRKLPLCWTAALLAVLLLAGCGKTPPTEQSVPQTAPSESSESTAPPESGGPSSGTLPPLSGPAESSRGAEASSSEAPSESQAESSEAPSQPSSSEENPEESAADPVDMLTIEAGNGETTYIFHALPQTASELEGLWGVHQSAPEHTAAFCVAAFCRYPQSKEDCFAMVDILRGPNPMNSSDQQFISDRFRDKDYVPRSYFAGAVPDNDYTPDEPWTLTVKTDTHSFDEENMARLYISSGGADSPRPITLRKAKDGSWYLWEYSSVLLGIRLPAAEDPWA